MSGISKRRREGSRAKIKSMGDHKEFLKRITKTLYYGQLPSLPCLSLPVTEISCEVWSEWQRGRSVRRLHTDAAAGISRAACVSPAALVLAILYLERLRAHNPSYLSNTPPADLFLVTLMVGNKFLQDDGEDEEVLCSEWATSGGIELDHLKKLELEFLNAIDWNIFVSDESFELGLQWLERRVALRQAALRGWFTYSELAAAGGGQLAALLAAAAAAASMLALLAGALLAGSVSTPSDLAKTVPQAFANNVPFPADFAPLMADSDSSPSPPALPSDPANTIPHTFPSPLSPTEYVPNSTLDTESLKRFESRLSCCAGWQRLKEPEPLSPSPLPPAIWSRTSVLMWLYQSSVVNPLQRWLDRLSEYSELTAGPPAAPCVRWLNLSKLGALVVSVSDR